MNGTDLQIVNTALTRLLEDADRRGWRYHAKRGCWRNEDRTSEFTIRPPAPEVRILPVRAHTPTGDLRLSVDPHQLGTAVQILRLFLGWPEGEAP